MSALYAVVASDFRYVPKDRTAYLAYTRMRRESANLNAWQAQRAYFSWLLRNDPTAFVMLDPVITVHPDQVLFEVFSKDEGAYAKLGIDRDALRDRRRRRPAARPTSTSARRCSSASSRCGATARPG